MLNSRQVFHHDFLSSKSYPWDETTLKGTYATILVCTLAVTTVTYTYVVYMAFFITASLQFDACRAYMKGLVGDLSNAAEQCIDTEIKAMFQHMITFHVAAKE